MKNKTCSKCGEDKPLSEFSFRKDNNKYRTYCKECKAKQDKKYQDQNKQKISQQNKDYYKDNKEKLLNYQDEYRDKNKEKIQKRNRLEYLKDKEKIKQRVKNYYLENSEQKKIYAKDYREVNPDKIKALRVKNRVKARAYEKEYNQKRSKTDLNFKLKLHLRKTLCKALKINSKSASTIDLLGCSIEHLKIYLENKFQPGMTWDNHSMYGWHIDHKRPLASFDLSKESEQRKAFFYTNLQPLWAEDNLKKADKY